jgi:demethylsterigmatocystin 6-O-methyltransferase
VKHQDFVAKTGTAPILMQHLLRSMASFGFIEELAKDTFQANRISKALASPHVSGAAPHISLVHFPVAQVLPQYLKKHKYQNMTNNRDLPFQNALNTDLTPFEYMKGDPVQMKALGHIMVLDATKHWVSSYPAIDTVGSFSAAPDSAVLVDVGGGFGQHSVAFRNKFTNLPGRIVVQDLPSTLAHIPSPKPAGIEFQEHDFFTEQPIRGAKFYYLRHILHDWPSEDCVRILQSIVPAMSSESLILIDEVVLPETNVPWQVAFMDLSMMACLGGLERSKEDWESLLDRAGLRVVNLHTYDDERFHSIVATVPK